MDTHYDSLHARSARGSPQPRQLAVPAVRAAPVRARTWTWPGPGWVSSWDWKVVTAWEGPRGFWWPPGSILGSVEWSHDFIIICYIVHLHVLRFWGEVICNVF